MKKILVIFAVLLIGLVFSEQLRKISLDGKFDLDLKSLIPKIWSQADKKSPKTVKTSPTPTRPPDVPKGTQEENLVLTIERTLPSVVTVGINFTTVGRDQLRFDPTDPFGGFQRVPGRSREVDQNIGSGFIVDKSGLIITNRHVVDREDAKYKVRLNDGTEYEVEKIYRDTLNDIAILKISPKGYLTPLKFADSDNLRLGQTTIAIGTPLGEFENSVTTGIISGLGRGITAGSPFEGFVEKLDNVIQTDAAISPGNSGGPLLNSLGQVIGVNTAVSQEGSNIGFAIPINIVNTMLENFENRGSTFERPYLGVMYQMIDRRTAIINDLVEGAYITQVVENSPAESAGLQEDDVITKINGVRISSSDDQSLADILQSKKIGEKIRVTYYRQDEEYTVDVTLGTMK